MILISVKTSNYKLISVLLLTISPQISTPSSITAEPMIFGFKTASQIHAETVNTVITTLDWNDTRYQCSLSPNRINTLYFCNISDYKTTFQCPSSNIIPYGLQIDNNDNDAIVIDQVLIQFNNPSNNILIEYFCFNSIFENSNQLQGTDHRLGAPHGGSTVLYVDIDNTNQPFQVIDINTYNSNKSESYVYSQTLSANVCCNNCDNYFIGPYPVNSFFKAQYYCQAQSTSLASIQSEIDQNAVQRICRSDCWIGLSDINSEGIWVWDDQSPYDYVYDFHPDNWQNNEDCVHIARSNSFKWNDINCNDLTLRYPLCNKS